MKRRRRNRRRLIGIGLVLAVASVATLPLAHGIGISKTAQAVDGACRAAERTLRSIGAGEEGVALHMVLVSMCRVPLETMFETAKAMLEAQGIRVTTRAVPLGWEGGRAVTWIAAPPASGCLPRPGAFATSPARCNVFFTHV